MYYFIPFNMCWNCPAINIAAQSVHMTAYCYIVQPYKKASILPIIFLITDRMKLVDPETLCQFTGLCDKNGKRIWENDIIQYGAVAAVVKFGEYGNGNLEFYVDFPEETNYRKDYTKLFGSVQKSQCKTRLLSAVLLLPHKQAVLTKNIPRIFLQSRLLSATLLFVFSAFRSCQKSLYCVQKCQQHRHAQNHHRQSAKQIDLCPSRSIPCIFAYTG